MRQEGQVQDVQGKQGRDLAFKPKEKFNKLVRNDNKNILEE